MIAPEAALRLVRAGLTWVSEQRDAHRPHAVPLQPAMRRDLSPWFGEAVLDAVRVRAVQCIENPPFLLDPPDELRRLAEKLPDFGQMAGITLSDTVLVATARGGDPAHAPLLFHELVHAVQYRELGIEGFLERYVTGFIEGGFEYSEIPLERDAYELESHFRDGSEPVSVEAEVRRRLSGGPVR